MSVGVWLAAASAAAQGTSSGRRANGLLGRPAPDPHGGHTLDANVSLFDAYDDDVTAEQGTGNDPRRPVSGNYSGLTASGAYARVSRWMTVQAAAGSNFRYYPSVGNVAIAASSGAIAIGVRHNSTTLHVAQTAGYQPFLAFTPFATAAPGEALTAEALTADSPALDATVARRTAVSIGTDVRLEQGLGRRTALAAFVGQNRIDYTEGDVTQRWIIAGGTVSHHLTKGASLRLGYQLQDARFVSSTEATAPRVQNIDIGIDYDKALGLTRKTSIAFHTGSSLADQGGSRAFLLTGDASFTREIGRTWTARADYRRGTTILPGINELAFAVSVQGDATPRVGLHAGASYSEGTLGVVRVTNQFGSYSASTGARYSLSRLVGLYGEYVNYWYEFAEDAGVSDGLPRRVRRQGVRGGLSLWIPLIR
jgi:hypothetical protein